MPSSNLYDDTEDVLRSTFDIVGQKCSACSRLYLHKDIARPFLGQLVAKTKSLKIGDPAARDTFLGPLINAAAVKKYGSEVSLGKRQGRLVYGGGALAEGDFSRSFFVEPAIVDR